MGKPLKDRTGHVYGRLSVVAREPNYRGNAMWRCICGCGKEVVALGNDLQRGKVKSCGCLNAERIFKHGMSRSRAYRTWKQMLQRCENRNHGSFANYGGRGISVSQEWHDFETFYADMGDPPEGMTLDRSDNNLGYSKENCRWATVREQLNNRRTNHILELNGERKTMAEWSELTGIGWHTLESRLRYGWSVERTLTEPINHSPRWHGSGKT